MLFSTQTVRAADRIPAQTHQICGFQSHHATVAAKRLSIFPLFSAVFPVNKNSVCMKYNKIVISDRQILTLFSG